MNLLLVGNGKGSWTMRGEQLGAALGARVRTTPTAEDWRWADLVILVKRAGAVFARQAHQAQVPIVWDALDFWRVVMADRTSDPDCARLILYAEMKLPGEAWLDFEITRGELRQTATFRPRGLLGRLYWHSILPLHLLLFPRMALRLAK